MKTIDAFAFRDFDEKKILQRPYFKKIRDEYKIGNETDAEIISALSLADDDSLSTLERKHKTADKIFSRLLEFVNFISRHSQKLQEYYKRIHKKYTGDNSNVGVVGSFQKAVNHELNKELLQKKITREQSLVLTYSLHALIALDDLANCIRDSWYSLEQKLQETYRENFGERLRQARIKAKLTRKQVSYRINISPNGYGQYESGRREPSLTSLIRLARTLDVSLDELIGVTP